MADRRYDEKQIAQILHQAAQLQSVTHPDAASEGLTLAEIQRLAEEVGIEPGLITQAASEVDIQTSPSGSPDRPYSILLDRAIDGQISEETWEDLIVRLRHYAGRPGEAKLNGTSREWIGRPEAGIITLMASQSGQRTRLRFMANFHSGASAWGILPFAGFFVGTMAGALSYKAFGAPVAFSVFGSIMSASVIYAALGVKRWGARKRQEVLALFETISARIESESSLQHAETPISKGLGGAKRAKPVESTTEASGEIRVRLGE